MKIYTEKLNQIKEIFDYEIEEAREYFLKPSTCDNIHLIKTIEQIGTFGDKGIFHLKVEIYPETYTTWFNIRAIYRVEKVLKETYRIFQFPKSRAVINVYPKESFVMLEMSLTY